MSSDLTVQLNRFLVLCVKLSYFALIFILETATMFIIIGIATALMILAVFSCDLHKPSSETHYLHYYEE